MKKILTLSLLLNLVLLSFGGYYAARRLQPKAVVIPTGELGRTYHDKVKHYATLPTDTTDIIMVGNSLTDYCKWDELLNNHRIKNRGIAGDNTAALLLRIKDIAAGRPAKLFIEIGTNDLTHQRPVKDLLNNYQAILDTVKTYAPATKIYIQGILPRNYPPVTNEQVRSLNGQLAQLAQKNKATYIDLFPAFSDAQGNIKKEITADGLHLNGQGYLIWKAVLLPYVD